jgi:hypothetical protein
VLIGADLVLCDDDGGAQLLPVATESVGATPASLIDRGMGWAKVRDGRPRFCH